MVAERIRSLGEKGRRLLHIGGWLHVIPFNGIENLAALLRDLGPQSVLL
jgi:hypothetical protein